MGKCGVHGMVRLAICMYVIDYDTCIYIIYKCRQIYHEHFRAIQNRVP